MKLHRQDFVLQSLVNLQVFLLSIVELNFAVRAHIHITLKPSVSKSLERKQHAIIYIIKGVRAFRIHIVGSEGFHEMHMLERKKIYSITSGLLDFVHRALRALRPCDPKSNAHACVCAFALDGGKKRRDGPTDQRTRCFLE